MPVYGKTKSELTEDSVDESSEDDNVVEIITENMGELIIRKLSEYLPYGFKI